MHGIWFLSEWTVPVLGGLCHIELSIRRHLTVLVLPATKYNSKICTVNYIFVAFWLGKVEGLALKLGREIIYFGLKIV